MTAADLIKKITDACEGDLTKTVLLDGIDSGGYDPCWKNDGRVTVAIEGHLLITGVGDDMREDGTKIL